MTADGTGSEAAGLLDAASDACATRNMLSEMIEKALDQKFAIKIVMLRGTRP